MLDISVLLTNQPKQFTQLPVLVLGIAPAQQLEFTCRLALGSLVWEKPQKLVAFLESLVWFVRAGVPALWRGFVGRVWKRPISNSISAGSAGAVVGVVLDLCCSKQELILENALLRQQLIVLRRQVMRPKLNKTDRTLLVLLAGRLRSWKSALLILQPDTLLRWHKAGFRLFWTRTSRIASRQRKIPPETIELIQRMAVENRSRTGCGVPSASEASC